MKTTFISAILVVIVALSFQPTNVSARTKISFIDTTCCAPDSLKVVSKIYPVFCVSWRVRTDSGCRVPYGFEVQWRQYSGGGGPWVGAIKIYTGGTTVNFCTRVDSCRVFQWRVRTICDTINGGHYSDWVNGNKIVMDCGIVSRTGVDDSMNHKEQAEKAKISSPAIKPKEQF